MARDNDRYYMQYALRLAAAVKGRTWPNPPVGAVLVHDGEIVSVGATKPAGQAHAERVCLEKTPLNRSNSVLYVTLEPCCHHGKTPPCTDLIIKSNVKRVVIAVLDPNPLVNGEGVKKLKRSGIDVEIGVCHDEANDLIKEFVYYMETGKPYVTLKYAMTLDGKLAADTGDSKWITAPAARAHVHRIRKETDAILVGAGTVKLDDPELTCRLKGINSQYQPKRFVLSPSGHLDKDKKIFSNNKNVTVITTPMGAREAAKNIPEIDYMEVERGESLIDQVIEKMTQRGIVSLLVEGGPVTLTSFMKAGLVNRIIVYIAPSIIGGDKYTPIQWMGFEKMTQKKKFSGDWTILDDDIVYIGFPEK